MASGCSQNLLNHVTSTNGYGVYGGSANSPGIYGGSANGWGGVFSGVNGVYGSASGNGYGVYGNGGGTAGGVGIRGDASTGGGGWGGYFTGGVAVNGPLCLNGSCYNNMPAISCNFAGSARVVYGDNTNAGGDKRGPLLLCTRMKETGLCENRRTVGARGDRGTGVEGDRREPCGA
ncbi:hypothetical protein [Bradyrhizobium sp. USDA 3256]